MDFGGGAVGYMEEIGEGFVASAGVAFGDIAHYGDSCAADLVFKGKVLLEGLGSGGGLVDAFYQFARSLPDLDVFEAFDFHIIFRV